MAAETKVILVGKTGVDAQLRRDRSIDLVHATTPLEALGHLSQASHSRVNPSVVLVGSDIDAELSAPANQLNPSSAAPSPTALERFIVGLRTVEAGVRVVRIGPDLPSLGNAAHLHGQFAGSTAVETSHGDAGVRNGPASLANGQHRPGDFDARLPANADRASLERVIRGAASTELPALDESQGVTDLYCPAAPLIGDEAIVRELARGRDISRIAIDTISQRLGCSARFLEAKNASPMGPSVAVQWEGHLFGHLMAQADPAVLHPHAQWLASWLHLQESQATLRRAALTDPLTGAWNRRYFERFLAAAINNARAKRLHVTILLFDIDNFKRYNDEFGHDAGDEILIEAVRLMRSVIRPTDRVCRIGGDEFAVIFHDPQGPRIHGSSNSVSVVELANRFRRQIIEHKFPKLTSLAKGTLTISGGMAAFPWDGATPADLLTRADQLARESKLAGKDAITFGPGAIKAGLNTPV